MEIPKPAGHLAAILLVPLVLASPGRGAPLQVGFRTGEQPYSVAMHMHSSFSEGDGSFEWHSDKATQYNQDVIWWSEHDWRTYHWHYTNKYTFENTFYEQQYGRWSEPDDAFPGEFRYWQISGVPTSIYATAVVDSIAFQGTKSFLFSADDPLTSPNFRKIYWQQEGSNKQSKYSLSSRLKVRFSIFPEPFDTANAKFVMEMGLSKHPAGDHVLRYVLGSMAEEPSTSTQLPFTFNTWNTYELDVTADAIAKFTQGGIDSLRGEDNALYKMRMALEVRQGVAAKVFVDDFRYIVDPSLDSEYFIDKQEQFASYYETLFPNVHQLVGTEISKFRAQPHMNAFTPQPLLVDYGQHVWSDTIYYAVDQVHAAQGAISMNHLFGSGIYNVSETPEQQAQRVHNKKLEMLATKCYRADMLEVGYRWRGGIVLDDHLEVWDTVTGNGVYVTGTGVTDSHGTEPFNGWGPWQPHASMENNFTTWLYAKQISRLEFIDAMFAGRAFFGDPNLFDGVLDLASGEGFPMGRVVLTDRPQHDLLVHIEPVPPDVQVRLLQGEIRTSGPQYLFVNYLRDEILTGTMVGQAFTDTVTLNTTLPSFARIEVRSGAGAVWTFSNPLHFIRQLPANGIESHRVGGVLGPLTIRSASKFRWKTADFDAGAGHLSLGGDESPAGEGSLVIECGELGAPGAVLGADVFSFEAGVLTLSGFSGAESKIDVFWSTVGVLDQIPTITEVSLGTGYPNPFRDAGMVCEFALPEATHARLQVHDVQGRLVRVLVDENRDAGIHRIAWDGNDAYGKPAANGVYFLRLQAQGRSLTSKAVKTR